MPLPPNPYVDFRDEGYYLAGSRISLDSIAYALRRDESVEQILAEFPSLRSRSRLEGAIKFIHAHRDEIDVYLADEERQWEEARKLNPPELVQQLRRTKGLRSA